MKENILTYLWLVIFIASISLCILGVLRWLGNDQKEKKAEWYERNRKLNIVAWCAFVVLLGMIVAIGWEKIAYILQNINLKEFTEPKNLIDTIKSSGEILSVGIVAILAVIILLVFIGIVIYAVWLIVQTVREVFRRIEDEENNGVSGGKDENAEKIKENRDFEKYLDGSRKPISALLNNPVLLTIFSVSILIMFLLTPLIVGGNTEQQSNIDEIKNIDEINGMSDDLGGYWIRGIKVIYDVVMHDQNSAEKSDSLVMAIAIYALLFIVVLGIGFAAINILYQIIKNVFDTKKGNDFWREYSNSIGLLAVGIALLMTVLSYDGNGEDTGGFNGFNIIGKAISPAITVITLFAIGILILEIVRLLTDMKETLIRTEARYLFAMLIGQCTLILIAILGTLYSAICSVVLGEAQQFLYDESKLRYIRERIERNVMQDMIKEIKNPDQNGSNTKSTYRSFKKKITKK